MALSGGVSSGSHWKGVTTILTMTGACTSGVSHAWKAELPWRAEVEETGCGRGRLQRQFQGVGLKQLERQTGH